MTRNTLVGKAAQQQKTQTIPIRRCSAAEPPLSALTRVKEKSGGNPIVYSVHGKREAKHWGHMLLHFCSLKLGYVSDSRRASET